MKIIGVPITHPDKVWFPAGNITKLEVIKYYERVADMMLPYLKNRPLTLHRFPDGIKEKGFYQKNIADYFPDFIHTVKVRTKEGYNEQAMCNNKKSLIYLVNQGTIDFHTWLSQADQLYKPNKIVFDLDPPENSFKLVKKATQRTVGFLEKKGKKPSVMTTGKQGFHVWFTRRRTKTFDELQPLIKNLAEELKEENPQLFTTALRKDKREGKVFIDYFRNSYGQTAVCPYSLRPTSDMGIATPMKTKELDNLQKVSQFNFTSIEQKIKEES